MNIIEKMATANKCYQTEGNFTPKGIVLHSIGVGQPSAESGYDYRLKDTLEWELYELPPVPEDDEITAEDYESALA